MKLKKTFKGFEWLVFYFTLFYPSFFYHRLLATQTVKNIKRRSGKSKRSEWILCYFHYIVFKLFNHGLLLILQSRNSLKKEIKVSLLYFKELYIIITFKNLSAKYVYHIWKPDGKCFNNSIKTNQLDSIWCTD